MDIDISKSLVVDATVFKSKIEERRQWEVRCKERREARLTSSPTLHNDSSRKSFSLNSYAGAIERPDLKFRSGLVPDTEVSDRDLLKTKTMKCKLKPLSLQTTLEKALVAAPKLLEKVQNSVQKESTLGDKSPYISRFQTLHKHRMTLSADAKMKPFLSKFEEENEMLVNQSTEKGSVDRVYSERRLLRSSGMNDDNSSMSKNANELIKQYQPLSSRQTESHDPAATVLPGMRSITIRSKGSLDKFQVLNPSRNSAQAYSNATDNADGDDPGLVTNTLGSALDQNSVLTDTTTGDVESRLSDRSIFVPSQLAPETMARWDDHAREKAGPAIRMANELRRKRGGESRQAQLTSVRRASPMSIAQLGPSTREEEFLLTFPGAVARTRCTQCFGVGTLYCEDCGHAFCPLCWPKIPHHNLEDVAEYVATFHDCFPGTTGKGEKFRRSMDRAANCAESSDHHLPVSPPPVSKRQQVELARQNFVLLSQPSSELFEGLTSSERYSSNLEEKGGNDQDFLRSAMSRHAKSVIENSQCSSEHMHVRITEGSLDYSRAELTYDDEAGGAAVEAPVNEVDGVAFLETKDRETEDFSPLGNDWRRDFDVDAAAAVSEDKAGDKDDAVVTSSRGDAREKTEERPTTPEAEAVVDSAADISRTEPPREPPMGLQQVEVKVMAKRQFVDEKGATIPMLDEPKLSVRPSAAYLQPLAPPLRKGGLSSGLNFADKWADFHLQVLHYVGKHNDIEVPTPAQRAQKRDAEYKRLALLAAQAAERNLVEKLKREGTYNRKEMKRRKERKAAKSTFHPAVISLSSGGASFVPFHATRADAIPLEGIVKDVAWDSTWPTATEAPSRNISVINGVPVMMQAETTGSPPKHAKSKSKSKSKTPNDALLLGEDGLLTNRQHHGIFHEDIGDIVAVAMAHKRSPGDTMTSTASAMPATETGEAVVSEGSGKPVLSARKSEAVLIPDASILPPSSPGSNFGSTNFSVNTG